VTDPQPPDNAPKTILTVTTSFENGDEGEEVYDTLSHAWQYKRELCFFDRAGHVCRMPISRVVLWKVEAA